MEQSAQVISSAYRSPLVGWGLIATGIAIMVLWYFMYLLHRADGATFDDIAGPIIYFTFFSILLILGGIFIIIFTTHSWRCKFESDHIIIYHGFFGSTEKITIPGKDMQDVFWQSKVIASWIGVGDIWIKTTDDNSHVLPGVRNPDHYTGQIKEIMSKS